MGQATFISAYCMLLIMARAQRFDRTQEEAAFDLGASHTPGVHAGHPAIPAAGVDLLGGAGLHAVF
jgi:hypothetical protein